MADVDVVARLQLRAEQFSSETGKAFADMRSRAAGAAQSVRAEFVGSFAEVQRLAKQALTLPRTSAGALDLSGEIASQRRSAIANEERARAARELAVALTGAASAGRLDAQAATLEADAARVAAAAADQDAKANLKRMFALEQVQGELNRTAVASDAATKSAARSTGQTALQRAGYQQLGFQLNDIATSLMGGARPAQVFAQQSSQLFQALQMVAAGAGGAAQATAKAGDASGDAGVDVEGLGEKATQVAEKAQGMGGKLGAVAAFMAGPWGAAVTIGAGLLIPFVAKLFEGSDALGDQVKKLKEHAAQELLSARANEVWARSLDGMIENTRKLTTEMERQLATQDQLDQQRLTTANVDVTSANAALNKAYSDRAAAQKLLAAARIAADDAMDNPKGRQAALARVAVAQAKLAKAKKEIEEAAALIVSRQALVRGAELPIEERKIAGAMDAATAATDRYTAALGRLRKERQEGLIDLPAFRRQLLSLQQQRDREVKAAQDAQKVAQPSRAADPDTLTSAAVARMLRQQLPGVQITATTNGRHVIGSDHYAGRGVDFVPAGGMGSMTKDDIRDLFSRLGVPIRRNAAGVEQLFGPGDPGHSNHFHVAWEKGTQALANFTDAAKRAQEAALVVKDILGDANRIGEAAIGNWRPQATTLGDTALIDPLNRRNQFPQQAASIDGEARDATREQVDYAVDYWREQNSEALRYLSGLYGDLFNGQTSNIVDNLRRLGSDALGKFLSEQTVRLFGNLPKGLQSMLKGSAGEGAAFGLAGGSVFSAITGGRQDPLASQVGGVLGDVAGKAIGRTVASSASGLLKSLGGAAGPIGAIAGSILGNVLGGLFKKVDSGTATISNGKVSASGTSSSLTQAANSLGGSVTSGLQKIADALGATLGDYAVSIGTFDGTYRVSTTGFGGSLNSKAAKGQGLNYFGEDEAAAIKFAISDAVKDGALLGLSAASQRLLQSGADIEKQLAKAILLEAIPKDLKAALDPVGAALDDLNRKWKQTVDALNEAGASAEQRAQAEQLYRLQLDQVKASTASASQGLKDFLTSLKVGSGSPYSLRDQEATARAQLAPFLSAIEAGQGIDQSKYQDAAKSFLDIERQLYGSTQAYFDQMEAIQATTNKAISTIDNAVPITTPVESPFLEATAKNTATGNELLAQISDQFSGMTAALEQLAAATGQDVSGFIGTGRNFKVGNG